MAAKALEDLTMPLTLTIRDEAVTGETTGTMNLEFLTEHVTIRELIRSRVYQEVQDHNLRKHAGAFAGLVRPSEEETALNGERPPLRHREIDWRRQYEVACDAFNRRGFLVLIDAKQADRLDEQVTLRADSQVSFLKLVPLVGG